MVSKITTVVTIVALVFGIFTLNWMNDLLQELRVENDMLRLDLCSACYRQGIEATQSREYMSGYQDCVCDFMSQTEECFYGAESETE